MCNKGHDRGIIEFKDGSENADATESCRRIH